MSRSDDLAKKLLDHELGGPSYTRPATVYVGLGASGVEFSGNGYARAGVANTTTNWTAAAARTKSNATGIQFARATVGSPGWGLATDFFLFDAAAGGNEMRRGTLTNGPLLVQGGDAPYIAAGELIITETP